MRKQQPALGRGDIAFVTIAFAFGISAHAIGAAKLHLFGDVEVVERRLPAYPAVKRQRASDGLQAIGAELELGIAAVGARGSGIGGAGERRADVEVTHAQIDRKAVPATAAPVVVMVSGQTNRGDVCAAIGVAGERANIIAQYAMVQFEPGLQVVVVRPDQRIARIETGDMLAAMCVEDFELLAQAIMEIGVGCAQRQVAGLRLVRRAAVLETFARC